MGVRHAKKEELERLESKTLDAQFLAIMREGLGCSAFEAEAVLEAVKEVYFPFLDAAAGQAPPGKVTLVAVDADEPAGKPIAACQKVAVCLSVHRGTEDDRAGEPAVVGAWSEDSSRVRIELDTVAGQEALYFRRTEGGLVSESISDFEVFEGKALARQRAFENGREASRAGKCREAIRLFDEAGRLGHPLAHEALAWELATAAAVECHDGPRAIGEAKAALATGETAERLDTLAAAYARNGDFDSALQAQSKALALLNAGGSESRGRSERRQAYEDRWSFYELRQAYQRDP